MGYKTYWGKGVIFLTYMALSLFMALVVHAKGRDPKPVSSKNAASMLMLDGLHRFIKSDGPPEKWASPAFDDSGWKKVRVPEGWGQLGLEDRKGIGWYRLRFVWPQEFEKLSRPAVYLGVISDADEVFLNGVRIGSSGRIENGFVLPPHGLHRLYAIPETLLRPGGENVLAVRVFNLYHQGGILGPHLYVGEWGELYPLVVGPRLRAFVVETSVMAVVAVFLVGTGLVWVKGNRDRRYLWLFLVLLLYMAYLFLDSNIFYLTGLKGPFCQRLSMALVAIWFPCFLAFLHGLFQLSPGTLEQGFHWMAILYALGLISFLTLDTSQVFIATWLLTMVPAAVFLVTRVVIRSMGNAGGRKATASVLTGVLVLTVSGIAGELSFAFNLKQLPLFTYLYPWDFGMLFFMATLIYAMAVSFFENHRRAVLLSSRIIRAQEQERKRLARDLHDELAQMLLTTKYRLEAVQARYNDRTISWCVRLLDSAIKSLRETKLS